MRGTGKTPKRILKLDRRYQSVILARFINKVMLRGQRKTAEDLVYGALEIAEKKLEKTGLEIFETVIENGRPLMEVRSRRIGGANYQVPSEVSKDRSETLAMRWLIGFSRKGKGQTFAKKLAQEIIATYNKEGSVMKKREDTHKMAEANRAFAHFARF